MVLEHSNVTANTKADKLAKEPTCMYVHSARIIHWHCQNLKGPTVESTAKCLSSTTQLLAQKVRVKDTYKPCKL